MSLTHEEITASSEDASISFEHKPLCSEDIFVLLDTLKMNANLIRLNLSNSPLGKLEIDLLINLLNKANRLIELKLNNCQLGSYALGLLLNKVPSTSIKVLHLDRNPFDKTCLFVLESFKRTYPYIELLYSSTLSPRDGSRTKNNYLLMYEEKANQPRLPQGALVQAAKAEQPKKLSPKGK